MTIQRKNLAKGRPPTARHPKSITRKTTRKIINKFHDLQKKKEQALRHGDAKEAATLDSRLSDLGGIKQYQEASLQGQRDDRGGDTSKILMEWLRPALSAGLDTESKKFRMLEVGALSTRNACSMSGCFDIERIDLNSQGPGILQQDFLQRPLPMNESELFDIISLSLVLNFVPTPPDRGEMLKRTTNFLYPSCHNADGRIGDLFPSVFLVLPTPCIANSRYLDQARLQAVMEGLGFALARIKETPRLSYTLWRKVSIASRVPAAFTKKEIRAGRTRNNFAIVLEEG